VPVDLVGHQAADLLVAEVEDVAEERVDAAAGLQRGLYGPLATTMSPSSTSRVSWMSGRPREASFSIAFSNAVLPLSLK
jgi:hypothetical protein